MVKAVRSMLKNDDGATLVEYALIVSLIAVAAIAVINTLGKNLRTTLTNASDQLGTAARN